MRREDIISRIRKHADAIRAEGATALYFFGSVARDQAQAESDIDVFVDYDPKSKFSPQYVRHTAYHHGRNWTRGRYHDQQLAAPSPQRSHPSGGNPHFMTPPRDMRVVIDA